MPETVGDVRLDERERRELTFASGLRMLEVDVLSAARLDLFLEG